jgi:hypothetical protein
MNRRSTERPRERRLTASAQLRLLILLLLGAAGAVAAFLLLTPAGAAFVVRRAVAIAAPAERVTFRTVTGSLARGFSVHGLELWHARALPPGNRVSIERVAVVPYAPAALRRLGITITGARVAFEGLPVRLAARRLEGDALGEWSLHDLDVRNLSGLPPGSRLKVQRIDAAFPLRGERVRAIYNARLFLPYSGAILLFATQHDGRLDLQVYAKTLHLQELLGALPAQRTSRRVSGLVTDVNLRASGSLTAVEITGTYQVERFARRRWALVRCPGSLKLRATGLPDQVALEGDLTAHGGAVATKAATIRLREGTLTFAGDPSRPVANVKGTSTIDDTVIHVTLTGNLKAPELTLSSFPPRDQERLLVMLITGRSWKGADSTLSEGRLAPDLVKEVIDYFVFDGSAERLAKRVGLSDISLTYDPATQEIGAKTVFFDKVETSYALGQAPADARHPSPTQKVGAGYRLTKDASMQLEAERGLPLHEGAEGPAPPSEAAVAPHEESLFDKIILIFKRRF